MAYGLSRSIWGGKFFLLLALFTLLFTPGIIPNYLAVKQYGLLNSYAALILPSWSTPSTWSCCGSSS